MAFNVLLKILGSLPSRIGGCQFKLTPDEHKLSLHLLNIVEPFVGLAPSRRTITRQPTEILDSIAYHVDSKRDLLSLALSCQRMHDIVFPRHFQYRHIRCKVSSLSVWNHLMVHRSLARNVRRLEILDERAASAEVFIPSDILASDTDMESTDDELGMHDKQERFLIGALGKMTSLASFTWACNHSPISIDHVWPTLLKCHSLQEVDISDNLAFSSSEVADAELTSSTTRNRRPIVLPGLKTVTVKSTKHAYGSTKHPVLSRIGGMLGHCPNLETLDIAYAVPRNFPNAHPTADELLLYSRFPRLTSLSLTNLRCTIADAPSAFLATHANITHLRLDLGASARLELPPNALPHLRELHCSRDVATAVLACPSDSPRPLETLKGVRLAGPAAPCAEPGASADQRFLASLRRFGADVRRIELAGWSEMEDIRRLAESVPGLVWLDVGTKGVAGATSRGPPVSNAAEWATLLAGLPELTTFHGVRFFYEVSAALSTSANLTMADRSRVRKNDEVAGVLAWKCTKLRRVDHWEVGGGKVVVLVRDGERERGGEKVRWEVRRVKT
ncbi:hypothetical protein B0H10DRAFT_2118982 [Mycena sp. CBHHK59/15]|nr:hypothetical protein B0H10DRAFT_2118982 [Mycena sp. CBHHK59/15]